MNAVEVVDAAIARGLEYSSDKGARAVLEFAVGNTGVGRPWDGAGWPEVVAAARAGDQVAVELLCRHVDVVGL